MMILSKKNRKDSDDDLNDKEKENKEIVDNKIEIKDENPQEKNEEEKQENNKKEIIEEDEKDNLIDVK